MTQTQTTNNLPTSINGSTKTTKGFTKGSQVREALATLVADVGSVSALQSVVRVLEDSDLLDSIVSTLAKLRDTPDRVGVPHPLNPKQTIPAGEYVGMIADNRDDRKGLVKKDLSVLAKSIKASRK